MIETIYVKGEGWCSYLNGEVVGWGFASCYEAEVEAEVAAKLAGRW